MKKLFLLALIGVTILFIWLPLYAGLDEMTAAFFSINPVFLAVIFSMPFAMILVYSMRWNLLLKSVGINARFRTVVKYSLIGAAFNNITPMFKFGGEPFKCYLFSKELGVKKRRVLASLTTDSFITAVTLLVVIYIGVVGLLTFNVLDFYSMMLILTILLLPVSLGPYLFYNKKLLFSVTAKTSKIASRFSPDFARKIPGLAFEFRDSIQSSVKNMYVITGSVFLGLLERALEVLCLYIILQSLGISMDLYSCAVVLGVGILFGLIPLLPGGLVAYESSSIFVLGFLGVGPALAAAAIILWRIANYWLIMFAGLAIGWFHGIRFAMKNNF